MTGDAAVDLTVASIGIRGDGIAEHAGERIFLPLTAPGDRLRAVLGARRGDGRAGRVVDLLEPGERAAPVCPHFGNCGGCALQHLSDRAYANAKEAWLRAALRQHGLPEEPVRPLRRLPAGTRRRARFAVRRPRHAAAAPEIGFHERSSHAIVDMRTCAVLHPELLALVAPLRRLAPVLWPRGGAGAATATRADTGVDLLLDLAVQPGLAALEAMAEFAAALDLARLAFRVAGGPPAPVAQRRPVRISFAGIAVDLPAEAFLQASTEADAALTEAMLDGVGGPRSVADLFAGFGTFTFALARAARVHAVDGFGAAATAIEAAAARAGLAGRVSAERRDLEARPLLAEELARFDAVVFDPPRAGARAQSAQLARSRVPAIVAVSCNPATFARDARILVDGGYRLVAAQPIDCFVWAARLEVVARFERA
ncbi:MAG TPA: class I SAM-dependent RNA methyltransferase [Stellaceae bacterium]|nr:class I SAM-dependent RNA methyltransferase [Stellaceae bacterium]